MKAISTALLLALVTTALLAASAAYGDTGTKFGPWRYFGPYYFPKVNPATGVCFTPEDFRPKYESPHPKAPGPVYYVPPPRKKKVSKTRRPGPRPPHSVMKPHPPGPQGRRPMPVRQARGPYGEFDEEMNPAPRSYQMRAPSSSMGQAQTNHYGSPHMVSPPAPGGYAPRGY